MVSNIHTSLCFLVKEHLLHVPLFPPVFPSVSIISHLYYHRSLSLSFQPHLHYAPPSLPPSLSHLHPFLSAFAPSPPSSCVTAETCHLLHLTLKQVFFFESGSILELCEAPGHTHTHTHFVITQVLRYG